MNNQTIQNEPADRSDEAISELEKQLRSIWQGCQSLKITFADDDIESDVQEIRNLLDEEPSC